MPMHKAQSLKVKVYALKTEDKNGIVIINNCIRIPSKME